MWTYRASLIGVVDGYTVNLFLDLGFSTGQWVQVAVNGLDTPAYGEVNEHTGRVKEFAVRWFGDAQAKAAVQAKADGKPVNWTLTVRTVDEDMHGRWVADVYDVEGRSLAEDIIDSLGPV